MSDRILIVIALICGMFFGMFLISLFIANDEKITHCPQCKYYYPPVCTFHKWLPMVSRSGFCYHARRGKYKGGTPKIESDNRGEDITDTSRRENHKCK